MPTIEKLRKFLHSPRKAQKCIRKLKNIPYTMRCRQLVASVRAAPFQHGLNTKDRNQKIIVSLTSYPARLRSISLCLKSLLLQSAKPDKIILWLDCAAGEVPPEVMSFSRYGISIECGVADLKPHKKYFFAMQRYPEDIIITVDDDVVYPHDLVESLLKGHSAYPGCVCARRVHKITFDQGGNILPYAQWLDKYKKELNPSYLLVPTGVGGVLYPPHCLDQRAFDIPVIMEHCLMADDIWLKTMEVLNRTKVVWVPNNILTPPYTDHSQETGLYLANVHQNRNDAFVRNIFSLYGKELRGILQERT